MKHLLGCLESHLADAVVAELQRYRKDIFEHRFCLINFGESIELMGYFVSHTPFLWVLLQNQKDID
jgi:hypothetical protein